MRESKAQTGEEGYFLPRPIPPLNIKREKSLWRIDVVDYFLSRWEVGVVVFLSIIVSSLFWWWIG